MSREMDKPLISLHLVDSDTSLAKVPDEAPKVGILGSGDFARSLATRLVSSGFKVVVGSRNPKRTAGLFPSAAQVTFQEEAVSSPEVIFVAVFREHYSSLCSLSDQLAGKILVDVSNPTEQEHLQHRESNAEYLASLFPTCTVVKAFNVISAWTLQAGPRDGNRQDLKTLMSLQWDLVGQSSGFKVEKAGCGWLVELGLMHWLRALWSRGTSSRGAIPN
ncbi:Metalloreductase steap3 [Saguinus oedipus]|uniref:Metalloreductase steap3 n=1 Tax=Saguinus oedipus TaxID=9490 RepID=A0ABQ9VI58_SAGOE|nr:Metalloreductase steap3 [Saguinus oedipus]